MAGQCLVQIRIRLLISVTLDDHRMDLLLPWMEINMITSIPTYMHLEILNLLLHKMISVCSNSSDLGRISRLQRISKHNFLASIHGQTRRCLSHEGEDALLDPIYSTSQLDIML